MTVLFLWNLFVVVLDIIFSDFRKFTRTDKHLIFKYHYHCRLGFFRQNGNDATTYSLMVAREHTQRKKIIRLKGGYHGVHPWTQSPDHPGVLFDDAENIIIGKFNDIDDLKQIVKKYDGEIAGLISTPYHHPVFFDNEMPAPEYAARLNNFMMRIQALTT